MLKAYKYRIYPNQEQSVLIAKHFGCTRFIYNWALAKKIEAYQATQKTLHRYDLVPLIPKLKKEQETEWLKEVNSQSLQQELVYLELAFDKFFKEKKGFPKFKSKHGYQSFGCPQFVSVDFEAGTISFPKLPQVKAVLSRSFDGRIKTVTVSRTPTGKYFASVLVDDGKEFPAAKKYAEKTTVGVDVGLTHFATLSTGEKIDNPRHLKRRISKLRREQQRLSRKVKGSKNRNKQRLKVARVYEKVSNSRKDFLHKISTRLISENQAVAFETLNIQGMLKNQKLALHIADVGWGMFFGFSKYKAAWNGKTILQIGQWQPSSKQSVCGYVNHELKLSDRVWTCPQCGRTYDRDIQAAQNIKRWALHPENSVRQDMPEFTLAEIGVS